MSLKGFFSGFNSQAAANREERAGKTRQAMLDRALRLQQEDDELEKELKDARKNHVFAVDGVETTAQAATPSMIAPPAPKPAVTPLPETPPEGAVESQDFAQPYRAEISGVGSIAPPPPAPAPAPAPVAAKKQQTSIDDEYRFTRDFYVKKGRLDKAEATERQWQSHYEAKAARARAKYAELVTDDALKTAPEDLMRKRERAAWDEVSAAIGMLQFDIGRPAGVKLLNDIAGRLGLWDTNTQQATNIAADEKGNMVLVDQAGKPVMGKDGTPVEFPKADILKLLGMQGYEKVIEAKGNVIGITKNGQARELYRAPPEAAKPGSENADVTNARRQVDGILGVDSQTGKLMNDTPVTRRIRAQATTLAEAEAKGGVHGFAAGQAAVIRAAEAELRTALAKGDQGKADAAAIREVIASAKNAANGQAPGAPTAQPLEALRKKLGY